ncbi:type-IV secretion system protein TraC, partial [Escherichia coli EC1865]
WHLRGR